MAETISSSLSRNIGTSHVFAQMLVTLKSVHATQSCSHNFHIDTVKFMWYGCRRRHCFCTPHP